MFIIHKICNFCGKLGHKKDMITDIWQGRYLRGIGCPTYKDYYHEKCYVKKFNAIKCNCEKHWIKRKKK